VTLKTVDASRRTTLSTGVSAAGWFMLMVNEPRWGGATVDPTADESAAAGAFSRTRLEPILSGFSVRG
jgi:hypothetical protein